MKESCLTLDITVPDDFVEAESIVLQLRPAWFLCDIERKLFTTGITNKICGFFHNTDSKWDDMILIRVYGQNAEHIIDRAAEHRNMNILHSMGYGPPLYAVLNNALVYGFVQGEPTDVDIIREPIVRELVAREMVKLHSIDLSQYPDVDTSEILLYEMLNKLFQIVSFPLTNIEKQKSWEEFGKSLDDIRDEFEKMKELTARIADIPYGFTHNDLLLENVIYNKELGKVSFIDYEYGGYNYTYFDIGNYFAEHAGIVDKPNHFLYPDRDYAKQWLMIYFTELNRLCGDNSDISNSVLERACDVANLFALWSHMFWAVYSLVQAEHASVPFDYIAYAKSRLGAYFDKKDEFQAFIKNTHQLE